MSKKTKRYYSRKWLNKEGKGFIEVSGIKENSTYLNISIGDCSRHVTLDFDLYEARDGHSTRKMRLAKLDLLLSEIQAARDWFAAASDVN